MLDINAEHVLSLTEAAKILPGRPSTATTWRWWARGIRGVKLETTLIGGRRFTSREAIARFVAATNATRDQSGRPFRSPVARERAVREAEAGLRDAGV